MEREKSVLELALENTQRELMAYVRELSGRLNDPKLTQMLNDVSSLMRSNEIVSAMNGHLNGQQAKAKPDLDLSVLRDVAKPVFNVRASVKRLLAEIVGKEVSTPTLHQLMVKRYPDEDIVKSTISAFMSKLESDGYIKETFGGNGKEPKRYIVLKGDAQEEE
jgi:hypothetical protein